MKSRLSVLIALFAVAIASCSADTATPETAAPQPVTESTGGTEVPGESGSLVAYEFAPGTTFSYEVELSQDLEMTFEGNAADMSEEDFPEDAAINMQGVATFTHTVSEGPSDGTYEISIVGSFDDLAVSGQVDGEQIDDVGEVPDMAALEPVDVTVIIDDQGNVVVDDEAFGNLFEMMDPGALGGGAMPGATPGQFLGPALPEGGVAVGDTWETETETPGLGTDPIVTKSTSEVTGTETFEGREVLVIETTTTTSRIEIDFGDFLAGMFGAMGGDQAEEGVSLDELRFLMIIDGSEADVTAWVDPEDGTVVKADVHNRADFAMDMSLPDEETGEVSQALISMKLDQNLDYRLLEGGTA